MRMILSAFLIALISSQVAFTQNPPNKPVGGFIPGIVQNPDFPGGTPQELVDAIKEQIAGGALNAIIPVEHKNVRIPPLKMRAVNVAQLFEALSMASSRTRAYQTKFVDINTGGFSGKPQRPVQLLKRWSGASRLLHSSPSVTPINDDQLLAFFQGKAVAILRPAPNHAELLFPQ